MNTNYNYFLVHLLGNTVTLDNDEQDLKQRKLSCEINESLKQSHLLSELKEHFDNSKSYSNDVIDLLQSPFQVGVIKNLLQDPSFLNVIREEFNAINWNKRNMDLYELFQSEDLSKSVFKQIKVVYDFLKTDVMNFVSKITGFEFTNISATCSYYSDTDYLLVHDDRQDDRLVAFILYLTGKENWNKDWGGSLQLFSCDENGQPDKIVHDILPTNNQFVFFPVTNKTYHQVSKTKTFFFTFAVDISNFVLFR